MSTNQEQPTDVKASIAAALARKSPNIGVLIVAALAGSLEADNAAVAQLAAELEITRAKRDQLQTKCGRLKAELEITRAKRDQLQTGCVRLKAQLAEKDAPYKTALAGAIKGLERAQRERDAFKDLLAARGDGISSSQPISGAGKSASAERVTLEVTLDVRRHHPLPNWSDILRDAGALWPTESVRVVDEAIPPAPPRVHRGSGVFDANGDEVPWEGVVAALKDERDAAIRERDEARADAEKSAVRIKSQAENVAHFRAERDEARAQRNAAIDERESLREQLESVACRAATAETEADKLRARVRDWERVHQAAHLMASLESAPAARGAANSSAGPKSSTNGWLTEEERGVLETVAYEAETSASKPRWEQVARVTRSILARSSPPEVVLPKLHTRSEVNEAHKTSPCLWLRRPDVIAALAAAGVNVKEVGRE